jgi:putative endopeptidase
MENKVVYAIGGGTPSIPPIEESIDPARDFYMHVNRNWLKHLHLPPYEDSFGVSEEIEMDVRNSLLEALNHMRRTDPTDGLSMLATSFLHTTSQRSSVIDLQRFLNTFDCIKDADGIAEAIGKLNRIQSRSPLSLVVNTDTFDSLRCCVYLYEPSLGLPSKHYYTTAGNRILGQYSRLLQTLGRHMHIESFESAITIEAAILPYLTDMDATNNISYSHSPHSLRELERTYPAIPWRPMFSAWGLDEHAAEKLTFVVTNPRYIHHLQTMFSSTSLESWRIWMRSMAVLTFLEYLPPPFDDLHFTLFERSLKGIAKKLPQKNLTLKVLMTYAPQDLSRMFVHLAVPDGTRRHATALVARLEKATMERIRGLTWMSETTRRTALEKIRAMQFQIGFPNKWESETAVVAVDPTRPLRNIFELAAYDTSCMIEDLTRNRCKKREDRWEDGAFEVNAYYYPEGNMMVVPAGILRAPFFDLERSDAWNLGGIGAVIGHEITHGFDDDGRLFDAKGNYSDWWTEEDAATYKRMAQSMVELFDGVKYMGGKVNGKLTLSENLADLGGLAIALTALKRDLPKSPDAQKKAYREFFTSFAVSWRQKDRPKKAKQALLLDPHSPPPLRVNLIVRQFEEFYTAFDILPSHAGYIPPHERIVFW